MNCFKLLFLTFYMFSVASGLCLAQGPAVSAQLQYGKNGKFKIVQLADTHVIAGDPRSERALNNISAILDSEKPDFVIHTGDILYGEPAEESVRAALQPLVERGIPFAVALGNHDSDFAMLGKGFFFIYGRYSGCDTVYNDLKPNGARVFEFTEGNDGFRTWIRLCDGRIEQELYLFPGMTNLTSTR